MRKKIVDTLGTLVKNMSTAVVVGILSAGIVLGKPAQDSINHIHSLPQPIYDKDRSDFNDNNLETMLASATEISVSGKYETEVTIKVRKEIEENGKKKTIIEDVRKILKRDRRGSGTLTYVGNKDGHAFVLTARHVVNGPPKSFWGRNPLGTDPKIPNKVRRYDLKEKTISANFDGKAVKLELLKVGTINEDTALLRTIKKYTPKTAKPYNIFAETEKVKVGDVTYKVGFPFSLGKFLTNGSIVALKAPRIPNQWVWKNSYWIKSELNPGDSGGPCYVLNKGVPIIIGMNRSRMIYDPRGGRNPCRGIYGVTRADTIGKFLKREGYGWLYKTQPELKRAPKELPKKILKEEFY